MQSNNKTVPTSVDVTTYLETLSDDQRLDSLKIIQIMQSITGQPAVMWGSSIIGFGMRHYKYDSGREGDWMQIGFSPRKGKISLYITSEAQKYESQLQAMGKHQIGKGCIYIKQLSDINEKQLFDLIKTAYENGDFC